MFEPVFPTETAGDGKIVPNNIRTGESQPSSERRPAPKKKVRCKVCGFLFDLNKIDVSGGDMSGDGAGGEITVTEESGTMLNGDTITEYAPEQAYKKGAGCPFCFSKNGFSST